LGDEPRAAEDAKSEALAAFAAIAAFIDVSGETVTAEQARASDSLRAAAVRHLSAALEIMGRAKGGDA
jgi:tRNA threonylcarbamoyladenosine modification (KEOPS) complex Cgi121 subunit